MFETTNQIGIHVRHALARDLPIHSLELWKSRRILWHGQWIPDQCNHFGVSGGIPHVSHTRNMTSDIHSLIQFLVLALLSSLLGISHHGNHGPQLRGPDAPQKVQGFHKVGHVLPRRRCGSWIRMSWMPPDHPDSWGHQISTDVGTAKMISVDVDGWS